MKNYIILFTLLLFCCGNLFGQNADPAVSGVSFTPNVLEVSQVAELTFSLGNTGGSDIPAGSIEVTISNAYDYYESDGITAPEGVGGDMFDWEYVEQDYWRGTNKVVIPAFDGGLVTLPVTAKASTNGAFELANINVSLVNNFNAFKNSESNDNLQPGLKVTPGTNTCSADVDNDNICDDVDPCVGTLDVLGVCNGGCTADADNDGICDDVDPCVGTLDALGVCDGGCTADADNDNICDDVDPCVGTLDALGVCDGGCTADADNDGICDDVDPCVGTLDALGVCEGACTADADNDGICDDVDSCVGTLDALGVCEGACTADADKDGICDDVDPCVGTLDALGVCNGGCAADADNDGICDSVVTPIGDNADPAISGAKFSPNVIEVDQTVDLIFSFGNSGDSPIPANSIEVTISNPYDYYESDGVTPPSGAGADMFSWEYIEQDYWRGTNIVVIPEFGGGSVVLPVKAKAVTNGAFEVANINVQLTANLSAFNNSASNDNIQIGLKVTPQTYVCTKTGQSCDDEDDCTKNDVYDADCNCAGVYVDSDNDGICDEEDDCNGTIDITGLCNGGCTADADQDGICDDVDDCVGTVDILGVCNGDCTVDTDQDGICDDVDDCIGTVDAMGVCNGACTADTDKDGICDDVDDCVGTIDALGVCNGACTADADKDGICDDVDDCVGTIDALGVCNGACTVDADKDGICDDVDDCVGTVDAMGVCNGACTADADKDGICDDVDDCVGTVDAMGVCNGACTADADKDDICDDVDDCVGTVDAMGVCNGACTADADKDGICDDVDDCVGTIDALGVCNGACTADADKDGICDDLDDCVGTVDAIGTCNGACTADIDNDGICDDVDTCLKGAAENCDSEPTGKCGVGITLGKGSIQVTGLNKKLTFIAIYTGYFGKQVLVCPFSETCESSINLDGLDAGIYTIKILTGDTWGTLCHISEYVTIEAGDPSCTDKDGDGHCVDKDCDDNNASYPAVAGTTCDDGDSSTENDVVQADGCSCAGTPIVTVSACELVELIVAENELTVTNLTTPKEQVVIADSKGRLVYQCSGNCKDTETIPLEPGTYTVYVRMFTRSWKEICTIMEQITIEDTTPPTPPTPPTTGNEASCQEVAITYGNGEIHIVGEAGGTYYFKVQKRFGNWQLPIDCISDCGHEVHLESLEPGKYFIRIYGEGWKNICPIGGTEVEGGIEIELEGGSLTSSSSRSAAKVPTSNNTIPTTFSVYPNPASHQLTVDLSDFDGQALQLRVYNSLMKVVNQQEITPTDNRQKVIPVRSHKGGIYFVEVRTKDGVPMTKKVLVVR